MSELTVAQWTTEQLKAWGVKSVYGVIGDAILPFVDAIGKSDGINFYSVKHEATAALMASAEAKLLGRIGVCTATSGPGVANLLNGLADAKSDQAPVLAITGQVQSQKLSTDAKQYIDQSMFLAPLATFSGLVTTPMAMAPVLAKALRTALYEGAVTHIAVSLDVWNQKISNQVRTMEPYLSTSPSSDPMIIQAALKILNQAKRPAILAGRGIRSSGHLLIKLMEKWQAGACLTLGAKGSISGEHPLIMGGLGEGGSEASSTMLAEADLILIIGATWWPKPYVPLNIPIVQLDAKPINIGRNIPINFGIVGEISTTLPSIIDGLDYHEKSQWCSRLKALKGTWIQQIASETVADDSKITPGVLFTTLAKLFPKNSIIVLDVGDHTVWFNRIFNDIEHELLFSGNWRTMGFGLPAALSAQLAAPERQVFAIIGDGGISQNLAEFATAIRYQLPIKIIVVNNGYLAMEKDKLALAGFDQAVASLTNPNFADFAVGCGGKGYQIKQVNQLEPILQEAFARSEPVIIDVKVEPLSFPGLADKAQKIKPTSND